MNNPLRAFALILAVSGAAFAQGPGEKAAASDTAVTHIRQVDLLNHLLPILWTKKQINAILPALEKVRQTINLVHDNEYHKLLELDPKATAAIDKALKDGQVPSRDTLNEFNSELSKLALTRTVLGKQNEGIVYDAIVANLNSGQKKAMANDLDPKSIDPSVDASKLSDEDRIRYYIRNILLDPLTYDLLIKLTKSSFVQDS